VSDKNRFNRCRTGQPYAAPVLVGTIFSMAISFSVRHPHKKKIKKIIGMNLVKNFKLNSSW